MSETPIASIPSLGISSAASAKLPRRKFPQAWITTQTGEICSQRISRFPAQYWKPSPHIPLSNPMSSPIYLPENQSELWWRCGHTGYTHSSYSHLRHQFCQFCSPCGNYGVMSQDIPCDNRTEAVPETGSIASAALAHATNRICHEESSTTSQSSSNQAPCRRKYDAKPSPKRG